MVAHVLINRVKEEPETLSLFFLKKNSSFLLKKKERTPNRNYAKSTFQSGQSKERFGFTGL